MSVSVKGFLGVFRLSALLVVLALALALLSVSSPLVRLLSVLAAGALLYYKMPSLRTSFKSSLSSLRTTPGSRPLKAPFSALAHSLRSASPAAWFAAFAHSLRFPSFKTYFTALARSLRNTFARSTRLRTPLVLLSLALIAFYAFAVASVTVTSPNGGEYWRATKTVTWSAGGIDPAYKFYVYAWKDNNCPSPEDMSPPPLLLC